ncbi:dephospho-CoA kinase [Polaribacter pacificus]|uniref:Dephospho-CoA kinase n=1 Tax=Polaribacter pacificus TaxID=1775173 RepID=A0A917MH90_9FLAO|nr:dephospho-CoA kinase [Polaribacter pacificus]GGH03202.1 dephospho-CoA kinase [Polaribacter pacificus]
MVVGITGGIGSGKSTMASFLMSQGAVAIYNADAEAKQLMLTSSVIRGKIIEAFGAESYTEDGLNRSYLSELVFKDPHKLKQLNAIVHPEVYKHLNEFIVKNSTKDYILYENAILFENHSETLCDFIIFVKVDLEVRIARVMKRDGVSKETVLERINNQWLDAKKEIQSHYIVENNDLKTAQDQIISIHKKLTNKPV